VDTSPTWFEDLESKTPDLTPHIGFLHEAGIDFGWGPTSMVQWTMEHIHILGGFDWWGTLLVSAVVFRLAMLYPTIMSSDTMARLGHIKPQMDKINEEYKRLSDNGQATEALAYRQTEHKALKEFAGASTTGLWLPLAIQLPLGFATFRFLRNLCATPGVGRETGGIWWFADLSVADPYYILPVLMALWMHLFARVRVGHTHVNIANVRSLGIAALQAGFPLNQSVASHNH
jgi:YidC/Oxa1 family membrane protein insertase